MIKKLKQIVEGILWRISARWREHVKAEFQSRIARARITRELEEERRNQIYMIVVTRLELFMASALKCRYQEKWYLLVRAADWERIKSSIQERTPGDSPFPYSPFSLNGIPFVEDDDLAGRILLDILKKQQPRRMPFSLN